MASPAISNQSYLAQPPRDEHGRQRISKVLVLGQDETAKRVIETCKLLGIKSVAIRSSSDEYDAIAKADEFIYAGGPLEAGSAGQTRFQALIESARSLGVDAIHPGSDQLGTVPEFGAAVRRLGLMFLGPQEHALSVLQDTSTALQYLRDHAPDVPVVSDPTRHDSCTAQSQDCGGRTVVAHIVGDHSGNVVAVVEKEAGEYSKLSDKLEGKIRAVSVRIGTLLDFHGIGSVIFRTQEDTDDAYCLRVDSGMQIGQDCIAGHDAVALQIYVASDGRIADLPLKSRFDGPVPLIQRLSNLEHSMRTFRANAETNDPRSIAEPKNTVGASRVGIAAGRQAGPNVSRQSKSLISKRLDEVSISSGAHHLTRDFPNLRFGGFLSTRAREQSWKYSSVARAQERKSRHFALRLDTCVR